MGKDEKIIKSTKYFQRCDVPYRTRVWGRDAGKWQDTRTTKQV